MANRLPTTKQLQYFVAIVKHQHFGKAADSCYVSQPAFSVAIRELENTLNVQLVDRDNKNVVITAVGKAVAEQARQILIGLQGLHEIAGFSQGDMQGKLNLGVIPTIAPFLLPKVLPKLRKAYPKLQLVLVEAQTEELYRKLLDGTLDFLLLALPYDFRGVETMSLFRDRFRLACHKESELIDPKNYSVDKLPDESVFLLQDGHCLRDHALSACKISNQSKLSPISASSLLTLVQMIDADLGISYLPEMTVNSWLLNSTQVVTFPMKDAYRDIGLAWRKGSNREDDFKLFGDFVKENRS
jgi:LysR family hydrogen peroxide-inducible transcriptional activator